MSGFVVAFHIITCIFIILAVLLQVGKGAELGAAFGSMGQAQSSRGPQSFMAKFTSAVAVLFMITSATLTYETSVQQQTSVLDKVQVESPSPVAPVVPTVPTAPKP